MRGIIEEKVTVKDGEKETSYDIRFKHLMCDVAVDYARPMFKILANSISDMFDKDIIKAAASVIIRSSDLDLVHLSHVFLENSEVQVDGNLINFADKKNDYYYNTFFSGNINLLVHILAIIIKENFKGPFFELRELIFTPMMDMINTISDEMDQGKEKEKEKE